MLNTAQWKAMTRHKRVNRLTSVFQYFKREAYSCIVSTNRCFQSVFSYEPKCLKLGNISLLSQFSIFTTKFVMKQCRTVAADYRTVRFSKSFLLIIIGSCLIAGAHCALQFNVSTIIPEHYDPEMRPGNPYHENSEYFQ